jgi:hypothetical protein
MGLSASIERARPGHPARLTLFEATGVELIVATGRGRLAVAAEQRARLQDRYALLVTNRDTEVRRCDITRS